jgi:hypothetical protein
MSKEFAFKQLVWNGRAIHLPRKGDPYACCALSRKL